MSFVTSKVNYVVRHELTRISTKDFVSRKVRGEAVTSDQLLVTSDQLLVTSYQ